MMDVQLYDGDYVFVVRGLVAGDGICVISIAGSVYVKRIEQDLLEEKVRVISGNPPLPADGAGGGTGDYTW